MNELTGFGLELDCLMLIETTTDKPFDLDIIWADATIDSLNEKELTNAK